jgi:alpha-glutamyl/putrescinyl thymine pyrophosphorylase clade 1
MQSEIFEPTSKVFHTEPLSPLSIGGKNMEVSPVFSTYWRFAGERQAIFLRRMKDGRPGTEDSILSRFKFTNAYRVLDRTSQFLVREVIEKGEQTPIELYFRILLFKFFNKIETWQMLVRHFSGIRFSDFRFEQYDDVLTQALAEGRRIYSAAYIMPSGGRDGETKKHRSHLRLLQAMIKDGVPQRLRDSQSMQDGFSLLRSYPMIGDFLAYQFITDLNYSALTPYNEMEFVVPGPGAMDGLKKCFPNMVPSDAAGLIRYVCQNQVSFQRELGLEPVTLWGRDLQLIDCQNLFCETDKYSRIAHPDITGYSGRTRIKQTFKMKGPLPDLVFPAKWRMDLRPGLGVE